MSGKSERRGPARLFTILVGAAMVVGACSSSASPTPAAASQAAASQAAASQAAASQAAASQAAASGKPLAARCGGTNIFEIGFAQSNFAEPYRAATDAQITKLFQSVPQFHLTITDGTGDAGVQATQIQAFQTKGVDLLLSSPQDTVPGTPPITAVYNAGIPVILLDRTISTDAYTAFIGGDNVAIGKMAGEYVATKLLPNGGDVTAHPTIKFIYFANDEMESSGAIAINALGLKGKVLTGGTDGLVSPPGDNGMEQVASGEQAFTIIYPTNAPEAFAMAKDILLNCATSEPKTTNPATTLVDSSNVAQVTAQLKAEAGQ